MIFVPSPSALHKLINDHCVKVAEGNDALYNLKKTKCTCVRPKGMKNLYFSKVFLNDHGIIIVNKEKYLGPL